jgi:hypothetical protein
MTLGCGSWGGNVTSDNVSPIHLLDIKRVAFETRSVSGSKSKVQSQSQISGYKLQTEDQRPKTKDRTIKREEIAAIVDKFLSQKVQEKAPEMIATDNSEQIQNPESKIQNPNESPVKTIIHELKPQSSANGAKPSAVDFVSEEDVRRAIEKGEKIYITAKTILTPSARDLGEEKEIFARV